MENKKEKFYSPAFSQIAAVSVRRLAWALGGNMGQAVDNLVLCMPSMLNSEKICASCRDKTKCAVCIFGACSIPPYKLLELVRYTPPQNKEQTV